MSHVYALTCVLIMICWAYIYFKTYQLCGYNIVKFFSKSLEFKLAFGDKNKLVFTKRMWRFLIVYVGLCYLFFYLINNFVFSIFLKILDCTLIYLFTPVIVCLVHILLLPVEIAIKSFYIKKAGKRLAKKDCIKIGITGSYGKTSTKNILAQILEKQYKVCVTPGNFNTDMGVTKTILQKLDDEDVFIAEMGARKKGDIEKIAKFVRPDYAIITTIGAQHLETFGSLKNIENTKYELVEGVKEGGIIVFNGDSPSTKKLFSICPKEKYLTCDEKGYAYAKDVKINADGSTFFLIIDSHQIKVSTKLLGQININNIVTASALAYLLGISMEDIRSAIKHLEPTSHRLELMRSGKVVILDDSYNSNMIGAEEALKVLSSFDGQKIVVTPGFVELGEAGSEANFKLGAKIADVADYIIIMNETNKNYLLSGAISHNFDKKKIFFANNRKEQRSLLAKLTTSGCVVLFENDLPDNFS